VGVISARSVSQFRQGRQSPYLWQELRSFGAVVAAAMARAHAGRLAHDRAARRYDRRVERAVHDRGRWPTDAPIDRSEHELADWELLTDALVGALGRQGVMNVDQLRRGIESMPPDEYEPERAPRAGGRGKP